MKADEILEQFSKIWRREKKIVDAEVVSAKELSSEVIRNVKSYIVQATKANEVLLTNKVKKDILGGVIIKYGDKVLDGSMRARLEEMKKGMVK